MMAQLLRKQQFLIGFEACSVGGNLCLIKRQEVIGPGVKPAIIFAKMLHCRIAMEIFSFIPIDLCFYSLFSENLLQWAVVNPGTHTSAEHM